MEALNSDLFVSTYFHLPIKIIYTYQGRLFHESFKVHVTLSWYIQSRKEITDQSHEDRNVIRDDLRDVKVTQCTHEHLILRAISVTSLQGTSDNQYGLDSAETPIVMILNE